MIVGFDHVVIAVRDLEAGAAAYQTLLGRSVCDRFARDGVETALIGLDNIAVEIIAPGSGGEGADRVRAALEDGEGLKSLVFAAHDLRGLHHRAERVGLAPAAITARAQYDVFRFASERTHGVRLMALERLAPAPWSPGEEASVSGIDHIVVRTPDPERAAALYGARLGQEMRLDREVAGRRLLFFRCGDAILEVLHDASIDNGRDRFYGLSWRVANADQARARLVEAGLDVSEVRRGLKPGTRVFTVRDGACSVPTLMIEPSSKHD